MRPLAFLLVLTGALYADGAAFVPGQEQIQELAQVAVIKHLTGQEELTIATAFYTHSSDVAWVIPVPALPTVDTVPSGLFPALQEYATPLYRNPGLDCACSGSTMPLVGGSADSSGVNEVSGGILGDYEYEVLQASGADTLASYLQGLGFALPDSATDVFNQYLQKNWNYFMIAWLHDTTNADYMSRYIGIRLAFASDSIIYPLYISRIGATSSGVILYVVANHRQMFRGGELLFSGPVDASSFPNYPGFIDQPAYLTKLYKFFQPAGMQDIILRQAPDDKSYRAIEFYGGTGYATILGIFALFGVMLVVQVRRAKRRE
jgi:hypothetical protein